MASSSLLIWMEPVKLSLNALYFQLHLSKVLLLCVWLFNPVSYIVSEVPYSEILHVYFS